MKRILVAGAIGYLGHYVVKAFVFVKLKQGYKQQFLSQSRLLAPIILADHFNKKQQSC